MQPFFRDDITCLVDFIDDHQWEVLETLEAVSDLCKKDEKFALLAEGVVEKLKQAASLTEEASILLLEAGMEYFGENNGK